MAYLQSIIAGTTSLILAAGLAVAETGDEQAVKAKTEIDLIFDTAECLAYYEIVLASPAMDAIQHQLAELGKDLIELSIIIRGMDHDMVNEVSTSITPILGTTGAADLHEIYDQHCDDLEGRLDEAPPWEE